MHRTFSTIVIGVGLAVVFVVGSAELYRFAGAQIPSILPEAKPTPTPKPISKEAIQTERAETRQQLETLRGNIESANASIPQTILDEQKTQVNLLQRLVLMYDRQLNALNQLESHRTALQELERDLHRLRTQGLGEPPPYTFSQLDTLESAWLTGQEKLALLEQSTETSRQAIETARLQLQERETQWQLAKDAVDQSNAEGSQQTLLLLKQRTAQLELRIAQENLRLRRLEWQIQEAALQENQQRQQLRQEKIEILRHQAQFTQEALNERLAQIDAEIESLRVAKEKALENENWAGIKLAEALQQIAQAEEPSERLLEQENFRRIQRQRYAYEIETLENRTEWLIERKDIWQRRFDVFNRRAGNREFFNWLNESQARVEALEDEIQRFVQQLITWSRENLTLEERINATEEAAVRQALQEQLRQREARIQLGQENLNSAESVRRLHNKLITEIKRETEGWSLAEIYDVFMLRLEQFLNTRITLFAPAESEEQQAVLTYGKLLKAVMFLILGLLAAYYFSRYLVACLVRRAKLTEGAIAAIESLTYYCMVVAAVLMTLTTVDIPLTAFAFLGGALAIGVGFGTQNILNNFISGLILLIEHPIRVGDVIDMDGSFGTVVRIGARSTQVTTFDNIDLMIPNSTLLENRVTNLTRADDMIRRKINIHVSYGANLREVFRMIRKAVDDHGLVLSSPEPFVTLSNFGSSALEFTVYYWCQLTKYGNVLVLDSDIRHRIYSLFTDAGITIAYPQQDIHFDTDKPIPVQILQNEPEE